MIVYPIGISIRDRKKFLDFRKTIKVFKEERDDQEISLAETYSGPIFQITGLVGIAWLIFILYSGLNVSFYNESIKYQMPMLLGVVIIKYISLAINKFKTKKNLFYWNCAGYMAFLIIAVLIDYKNEMVGSS